MKTVKLKRPEKRPALCWSQAPSRSRDPALGLRKRWSTSCRRFVIEQFPEATGRFIALSRLPDFPRALIRQTNRRLPSHALGDFGTLAAARRACEIALKEAEAAAGPSGEKVSTQ